LGDDGARADDRTVADYGLIQNHGTHSDQAEIFDRTGMNDDAMSDGDIISDVAWTVLSGDMQGGIVLDIGAGPYSDRLDIRTNHGIKPDAGFGPYRQGAYELCSTGYEDIMAKMRALATVGENGSMRKDSHRGHSMDGKRQLSDFGIPHLELVLVEIFQIPPRDIFPEVIQPQTVQDLAIATGKSIDVIWGKLMNIRENARDIEIDVQALKEALTGSHPPLLLDVREPWEYDIAHIPGSLLLATLSFPDLLSKLQAASQVITICHHGIRSFSAAMYLKEQGVPQAKSLAGGVEAWALEVDPSMRRY
jgi:rhodanese-related sulfurtransferase